MAQRRLHALALQAEERVLVHALDGRLGRPVERVGAPPLLAPDGVDRPPVHEREDPRARLATLGHEAGGRPPDREERLLHRVLGELLVAQDAQRQPVGGTAVAVVQLGERRLLRPRGERDERFVGEVGELPVHSVRYSRAEAGRFKRSNRFTRSSESAPDRIPHGGLGGCPGRRGQWNA